MDLLDCHGLAVMKLDLRAAHASKGVDDARTTNQAESEQDQVQDVPPKKLNDDILVLLDVSQMITSFTSSVQFQEKSHGFRNAMRAHPYRGCKNPPTGTAAFTGNRSSETGRRREL